MNSKNISKLTTLDPVGPFINDTNMDEDEMVLFLHEQLTLTCFTFGIPKPKITWYKVSYLEEVLGAICK